MKKLLVLGLSASMFALGAAAQEAQETVNVSATLQIDPPAGAAISGLEDLTITLDGSTLLYGASSNFCLFSPSQFFAMTVTGANPSTAGQFTLIDTAQPAANATTRSLRYDVLLTDIFSGTGAPLGSAPSGRFQWGTPETGIDSNLFNTDDTCTDGENIELRISLTATGSNAISFEGNSDGQPHTFTDTLTLLVEPEI